jgi:hypothetical protein
MIANVPTYSVVDRTTTAAKIVMSVLLVKTDLEMIATGMTATTAGMIVHHIAATAPGHHLLVAPITTIVAPGLRPLGGRMIEGLQGTIMIDPHALGTIEDATRRMGVPSTRGPPGTEMAVGRAKIAHGIRDVGPDRKRTTSVIGFFLPESIGLGLHDNLALTYVRAECTFLHGLSPWSLPRSL